MAASVPKPGSSIPAIIDGHERGAAMCVRVGKGALYAAFSSGDR